MKALVVQKIRATTRVAPTQDVERDSDGRALTIVALQL